VSLPSRLGRRRSPNRCTGMLKMWCAHHGERQAEPSFFSIRGPLGVVRNPDEPGAFEEGLDLAFGVIESEAFTRSRPETVSDAAQSAAQSID